MKKQSENKAIVQQGILESLSGSISNLVVTKKGVIYFRAQKTKKK